MSKLDHSVPGDYRAICRSRLPNGAWNVDIYKHFKDGSVVRYTGVANDPYRIGYENAEIGYGSNTGFRNISNTDRWVIG